MLRRAKVDPVIAKALTGHVTEQMREHYSSVGLDEKRAAVASCCGSFRGEKLRTTVRTRAPPANNTAEAGAAKAAN
jgi:hypothetical protein